MWAVLYGSLAGARLGLAWRYTAIAPTAAAKPTPTVTVVQPILSGDPALVACLARNLENQPDARFLWLVDDNDAAGRAIAASLAQQLGRAAVTVVVGPPPCDGENPKMAKLMRAEAEVTSDVLLVLDDDTVLPPGGAAALAKLAQASDIATGLPVYASHATLAERLVAGFINGQALAIYFAMAAVGANRTINGMAYAVGTNGLAAMGGFSAAGHALTDDYAMAKLWRGRGRRIVQSAVFCEVVISFATLAAAASVLRRWLIFANRYLAENATPATVLLVVLPSVLPALGLCPAVAASWPGGAVLPGVLAAKALANGVLLRRLAGVATSPDRVCARWRPICRCRCSIWPRWCARRG
jgi:ceramide glucosyltransferase